MTDSEELYDVHRLVQLAARNWLTMEGSLTDCTKACITRMAQLFPTRDHKHKRTWTAYLPHARRLYKDGAVKDLPERYRLLEKMGLCFVVDGKYDEAVKMHTVVVQWRENTLGTSEPPTLDAYNNLGEALDWKGDRYAAERFLQQALKGQREIHGEEHPFTLTSMANLASTYRNQGRWKEAEELEVQVMETSLRVLGAEHPDKGRTPNVQQVERWRNSESQDRAHLKR
jgi:tetratricopeptide (TPR) repeat protein